MSGNQNPTLFESGFSLALTGIAAGLLIPPGIILQTTDPKNLNDSGPYLAASFLGVGLAAFSVLAGFTALKVFSRFCGREITYPIWNAWTAFGYSLAVNSLWGMASSVVRNFANSDVTLAVGVLGGMLSALVIGYTHMEKVRQQNQTAVGKTASLA